MQDSMVILHGSQQRLEIVVDERVPSFRVTASVPLWFRFPDVEQGNQVRYHHPSLLKLVCKFGGVWYASEPVNLPSFNFGIDGWML